MEISIKKLQKDFIKKVEELSGENIYACYQCGKCSAGCPIVEHMDILPSQIVRLLQIGCDEEALGSRTIWYCSNCLQCAAKCPKGVDVAKIMEALREIMKRKGRDKMDLMRIAEKMWEKLPQQAIVSKFRKFSS